MVHARAVRATDGYGGDRAGNIRARKGEGTTQDGPPPYRTDVRPDHEGISRRIVPQMYVTDAYLNPDPAHPMNAQCPWTCS